jgi:hypothetical protein
MSSTYLARSPLCAVGLGGNIRTGIEQLSLATSSTTHCAVSRLTALPSRQIRKHHCRPSNSLARAANEERIFQNRTSHCQEHLTLSGKVRDTLWLTSSTNDGESHVFKGGFLSPIRSREIALCTTNGGNLQVMKYDRVIAELSLVRS